MDVLRSVTAVFNSVLRLLMSVLREVFLSEISCKRDVLIVERDVLRSVTAVFNSDLRLLISVLREVLLSEIS